MLELPAQRVWLLHRATASSRTSADATNFASAIAVLGRTTVYILIVISDDAGRTDVRGLPGCMNHERLERDAFRFATLDDALDAADRIRERFIARGWRALADEEQLADIDNQEETS